MKGKTLPKLIGCTKIDEGRVIMCSPDTVIVMLNADCPEYSTCTACKEKNSCARAVKSETLHITGEHLPDCKPGMRTHIAHFVINKTIASLLVFVFPLLTAVVAMLFRQYITNATTESLWTIYAGGTGLLVGFLITAIVDRIIRNHLPPPEIVSVF